MPRASSPLPASGERERAAHAASHLGCRPHPRSLSFGHHCAKPPGARVIDRRRCVKLAAAAALAPALRPSRARAQTIIYPTRYVRLVVPFAPAGGADAIGRIMAGRLSELWGQQVVVENKGGAGGNIAADLVAHSEPDGYTLFLPSLGHAINRFLFPSLSYDPIADFAPISLVCTYPNIMVVPMSSPARTVQEFIAHAKANRGRITFASSSSGTSVASRGRDVQAHGPHRDDACRLSRRRAGLQRRHSGPHRRDVRDRELGAAADRGRQAARPRRDRAHAPALGAGHADHRRIRPAGLRRVVLVRTVRARQNAARDRRQDQRRRRHGRARSLLRGPARTGSPPRRSAPRPTSSPAISSRKWTNGARSSPRRASGWTSEGGVPCRARVVARKTPR